MTKRKSWCSSLLENCPEDIKKTLVYYIVFHITNEPRAICWLFRAFTKTMAVIVLCVLISFLLYWGLLIFTGINESISNNRRLPSTSEWEEENDEYVVQFEVVDAATGYGVSGTKISVGNHVLVTGPGGLTDYTTSAEGDEYILDKAGYRRKEGIIRRNDLETKYVEVKLTEIKELPSK